MGVSRQEEVLLARAQHLRRPGGLAGMVGGWLSELEHRGALLRTLSGEGVGDPVARKLRRVRASGLVEGR